jgi:pyrroloquinoline quinone (PQQ) biosynthesis protein C
MQYKIIEKFISFIIDKKDSSLIKIFPFSIEKRLKYFDEHKIIS